MPKWIGNRFGSVVPISPGNEAPSAIYNLFDQYYAAQENGWAAAPTGIVATGGVVSDYTTAPGDVYRAHIFTSSGIFDVTKLGAFGAGIEYLVVGGGGGGGGKSAQSGGGGAGGFRTNLAGHPLKAADYTAIVGQYTVTVGAGGLSQGSDSTIGTAGGNSEFYPTPVSYPSTARIRADGGGGGAGYSANPSPVMNGGSGGGASNSNSAKSGGSVITDPNHPQVQGYAGGSSEPVYTSPYAGGGGGGAGRLGAPDNPSTPLGRSTGGYGMQALIAGPPALPAPIGVPGPGSGAAATGYFAGGGGGGAYSATGSTAGYGGGGDGAPFSGTTQPSVGEAGTSSTGGGGGGGGHPAYAPGGNGGSGIVAVRYIIASITATAKATGGAISFYNNKTIHTFTNSGTFVTNAGFSETVEYLLIAGGGGGAGVTDGGGGGAGGFVSGTTSLSHPTSYTVTVGGGGQGGVMAYNIAPLYGRGIQGTPSVFGPGPISATGGGYGGSGAGSYKAGGPGGSGGGGGEATAGVSGTSGQGNTGGTGHPGAPDFGGGGGGGAGGTGANGTSTSGGAGGIGAQLPTTFRNPVSATSLGTPGPAGSFYVAGGGGGGTENNSPGDGGAGGAGGGGTSPGSGAGNPGVSNTGGGGGAEGGTSAHNGGSGGSGIVIIAYPS